MSIHNHGIDPSCPERKVGACLVTINPESVTQVQRLVFAFWDAQTDDGDSSDAVYMQTALRSLLPTPKPDMPRGLGAVVEDNEGYLWVRVWDEWVCPSWDNRPWSKIKVVRVLSEGVTP